MNRRFLNTHLTNAQAILLLVAANLMAMGYLISLTNYNHDTAISTQKQLITLVNSQGNLSSAQRQKIIQEFENLPDGGFAGQQLLEYHNKLTIQNQHLLEEILGNLTQKNLLHQ